MRHFSCTYREFEENPWKAKRLVWGGGEASEATETTKEKKEGDKGLDNKVTSELEMQRSNLNQQYVDRFKKLEQQFAELKAKIDTAKADPKKNAQELARLRALIKRDEGQIDKFTDELGKNLKYQTCEDKEELRKLIDQSDKLKMAAMKERGANQFEYLMMFKSPSFAGVVEDLKSLANGFSISKVMDMFGKYADKVGTVMAYYGKQAGDYVSSFFGEEEEKGDKGKAMDKKDKEGKDKKDDKKNDAAEKKKGGEKIKEKKKGIALGNVESEGSNVNINYELFEDGKGIQVVNSFGVTTRAYELGFLDNIPPDLQFVKNGENSFSIQEKKKNGKKMATISFDKDTGELKNFKKNSTAKNIFFELSEKNMETQIQLKKAIQLRNIDTQNNVISIGKEGEKKSTEYRLSAQNTEIRNEKGKAIVYIRNKKSGELLVDPKTGRINYNSFGSIYQIVPKENAAENAQEPIELVLKREIIIAEVKGNRIETTDGKKIEINKSEEFLKLFPEAQIIVKRKENSQDGEIFLIDRSKESGKFPMASFKVDKAYGIEYTISEYAKEYGFNLNLEDVNSPVIEADLPETRISEAGNEIIINGKGIKIGNKNSGEYKIGEYSPNGSTSEETPYWMKSFKVYKNIDGKPVPVAYFSLNKDGAIQHKSSFLVPYGNDKLIVLDKYRIDFNKDELKNSTALAVKVHENSGGIGIVSNFYLSGLEKDEYTTITPTVKTNGENALHIKVIRENGQEFSYLLKAVKGEDGKKKMSIRSLEKGGKTKIIEDSFYNIKKYEKWYRQKKMDEYAEKPKVKRKQTRIKVSRNA